MRTPARLRPAAMFSGVCPPNCTMAPSMPCVACTWRTSSTVSGSKNSWSEVSKSVDTVSGLLFTMMISKPRLRSSKQACTQQ